MGLRHISIVVFNYCITDDYKKQRPFLNAIQEHKLYTKMFFNSSTLKEVKVTLYELPSEEIKGCIRLALYSR